jgi:low molecular weight protein-tyrosine phosphatase
LSSRLPPPRDPEGTTYSIALVCLGNICRSPIAHVVLVRKLETVRTPRRVVVESSGTGDWHIGEPMDRRAAETLSRAGYDPSAHRARQVDPELFRRNDLILVMDDANFRDVGELAPSTADRERIMMFRSFDPAATDDLVVPDPWYGGPDGFDEVLAIVERTTDALASALVTSLVTSRASD